MSAWPVIHTEAHTQSIDIRMNLSQELNLPSICLYNILNLHAFAGMFFPLNRTDNIKIVQVNTGLYNHVIAKNKYMYLKDEICTRFRNVTHSLETRQVHHCHSGVLILQSYIQP